MKINLGAGPTRVDGWINVDMDLRQLFGKNRSGSLRIANLSRGKLPFKSESVDYIYTSHFLEHIKRENAEFLISECYRVLKQGGLIRVIVPDLDIFCKEWLNYKETGKTKFFDELNLPETPRPIDLFNRYFGNLYISNKTHFKSSVSKYFFARSIKKFGHKWFYDYNDLFTILNAARFSTIKKCKYKQGKCPDIAKLDNRPLESLYVEASK